MKSKLKYGLCAVLAFFAALCMCMCAAMYNSYAVSDVTLNVASLGEQQLTESSVTVGSETFKAYGCDSWGGYASLLTLDKSYDVSAIKNSGKGAVSLWLYIGNETCLNAYKALTDFGFNVGSGSGNIDENKLEFNFKNVFANCQVGWNKVVLPLSTGSEHGIDYTAVNRIRIVAVSVGGSPVSYIKYGKFTFTTTDKTAMTVTPYVPTVDPVTVKVASYSNVVGGESFAKATETVNDESLETYGIVSGGFAELLTLDKAYDVSAINGSGKGALTFYLNIGSEQCLTKFRDISSGGWNIDVCCSESYSDSNKYSFDIKTLFKSCQVGWNKITLPFATAAEKNNMNFATIRSIRLNCAGCNLNNAGDCNVKFAKFQFVVSDVTAMTATSLDGTVIPVEPDEPLPESVKVDATAGKTVEFASYEDFAVGSRAINGTTYKTYGCLSFNWANFVKVLYMDNYYDATDLFNTNQGALSFWMYIGDEATLNAYKAVTGNWNLDLSAGREYSDDCKYSFKVQSCFGDLKLGYNKIVLPFANAAEKNKMDWTTVHSIRINLTGTNLAAGKNNVSFAGFTLCKTTATSATVAEYFEYEEGAADKNAWMDARVILDCNSVDGVTFAGNRVDKEDFRYGSGCVYTSGYGYQLNATDIEVGETGLSKDSIVLAFWLWIEDISLYNNNKISSQVELGSTRNYDEYEINWDLKIWSKNLVTGWNWIALRGVDASVQGGLPDFDNLSRFRLWINDIDESTLKIDRITIGCAADESIFTAPDWQNEKADSGFYKGANGLEATNSGYIEVDFSADDYVPTTPSNPSSGSNGSSSKGGCSSDIGTVWYALIVCGVAAAFVIVRKIKAQR